MAGIGVTPAHGTNPTPASGETSTRHAPEGRVPVTPSVHSSDGADVALFVVYSPWDSEALFVILDPNGSSKQAEPVVVSNDPMNDDISVPVTVTVTG